MILLDWTKPSSMVGHPEDDRPRLTAMLGQGTAALVVMGGGVGRIIEGPKSNGRNEG